MVKAKTVKVTGLRKALRSVAPAALVGKGRYKGFRRRYVGPGSKVSSKKKPAKPAKKGSKKLTKSSISMGSMLQGLTKALTAKLHSKGDLPSIAKRAVIPRTGAWRGKGAGRRRGTAVDSQLSSIANGTRSRNSKGLHRLTRIALAFLEKNNIRLVCGQLPVVYDTGGIGSAIDLVGIKDGTTLVLIELKCGHDAGRTSPATLHGSEQMMRGPLARASDCVQHRHFAQLAATLHMFQTNTQTAQTLRDLGVSQITSQLMYVTDADVEVLTLPKWWVERGQRILWACR